MQSISYRIWTCVAVFISYDDNHYTTGTSPIDGLILMWHLPTELSSAQSQSQMQFRTQSRFCLIESLPRAVILLIVKLGRDFSQLSFVYVLFAFNIFLISYSCVVSSFEPPPWPQHLVYCENSWVFFLWLSMGSQRFCNVLVT